MQFSPEIECIKSISDSIKRLFRRCWVERFGCPPANGFRHSLDHHLHLIEFECPGADDDELWAAFDEVNRELCHLAYGSADNQYRHVGFGYIAKSPGRAERFVRALVLVHPSRQRAFGAACAMMLSGRRTGLSISSCDVDAADPDAAYRWLAEGIARHLATATTSFRRAAITSMPCRCC